MPTTILEANHVSDPVLGYYDWMSARSVAMEEMQNDITASQFASHVVAVNSVDDIVTNLDSISWSRLASLQQAVRNVTPFFVYDSERVEGRPDATSNIISALCRM